jgi:putative tryptophan/tyrosine transport system substrate-binding protein
MNRREFIPLLGGAAAWPITARAQVRKAYRIGTLTASAFEPSSHVIKAFEEGMAKLGYASQSNVIYEHRFAAGRLERLTDLAKELCGIERGRDCSGKQRCHIGSKTSNNDSSNCYDI